MANVHADLNFFMQIPSNPLTDSVATSIDKPVADLLLNRAKTAERPLEEM